MSLGRSHRLPASVPPTTSPVSFITDAEHEPQAGTTRSAPFEQLSSRLAWQQEEEKMEAKGIETVEPYEMNTDLLLPKFAPFATASNLIFPAPPSSRPPDEGEDDPQPQSEAALKPVSDPRQENSEIVELGV